MSVGAIRDVFTEITCGLIIVFSLVSILVGLVVLSTSVSGVLLVFLGIMLFFLGAVGLAIGGGGVDE